MPSNILSWKETPPGLVWPFLSLVGVFDFLKPVRLDDSRKLPNEELELSHVTLSPPLGGCNEQPGDPYGCAHIIRCFLTVLFSPKLADCRPTSTAFILYKKLINYPQGSISLRLYSSCLVSALPRWPNNLPKINLIPIHSIKLITVQVINHPLLKKPNFLDLRLENY